MSNTICGVICKKTDKTLTITTDGENKELPLSMRVVPFVGSLKEKDNVEYDVKANKDGVMEITFIKKVYKPYSKPVSKSETHLILQPLAEVTQHKPDVPVIVTNPPPKPTSNPVPAVQPTGDLPKTSMNEKDYKMSCMSALKGAVSIVEAAVTAAPNFMEINKDTISLQEMCDDLSDEVIQQADKLLDWMEKHWQDRRFK